MMINLHNHKTCAQMNTVKDSSILCDFCWLDPLLVREITRNVLSYTLNHGNLGKDM